MTGVCHGLSIHLPATAAPPAPGSVRHPSAAVGGCARHAAAAAAAPPAATGRTCFARSKARSLNGEKTGGLTKRNGDLTKRNGGLTKRNGDFIWQTFDLSDDNGDLASGHLTVCNGKSQFYR